MMENINELRVTYLNQFPEDGLSESEIKEIEDTLGITLPNDFIEIAKFFSGGNVGIVNFYDFKRQNPMNIINETIRLRNEINLPVNFLVLSEEAESIVLLDLINYPSVIWCDSVEVTNVITRKFENEPDYWNDFSDLFYEMLTDE